MAETNKPIMEFRVGAVKVAVWSKEKVTPDGKTYTEHNYTLSKSFKRKDSDQYEEQRITLFGDDLLAVAAVVGHAFDEYEIRVRQP